MQKRILRVFESLFLISVLTGTMLANIGEVEANPGISINADGSISQSGNLLQLYSTVSGVITYIFASNISDHIAVHRSDVVIDGRGWSLVGSGSGDGFSLGDGVNHVRIKNLTISNFATAIRNQDGSDNKYLGVANVTIQSCSYGVILQGGQSGFATIMNNTFAGVSVGIWDYYGAGNNFISGNTINATTNCIVANTVESNTIIGNVMNSNNNGISLRNEVSNTIISDNKFSTGAMGIDAGYGASDILISGNTFSCASVGIDIGGNQNSWSSNNTITANNIYASQNPTVTFNYVRDSVISQNTLMTWFSNIISFDHTNYNRIINNNLTATLSTGSCMNIYHSNYTYISENSMYSSAPIGNALGVGILITEGFNNTILRNIISNPKSQGITLDIAKSNIVSENTIVMWADVVGPTGIWITENSAHNELKNNVIFGRNDINSSTFGMQIASGASNSIIQNNVTGNKWGIYLGGAETTNNTIIGNNMTSNGVGVKVVQSSGNYLYNNNFLVNGGQVETDNSVNNWNTTLPKGGNYWSNYIGTDLNNDRIGDTPYTIDVNNVDNYPLMNLACATISTYTIAVTQTANGNISPGTSVVNYGATPSFTITPNLGYQIANITANGVPVVVNSSLGQSYQFSAVSADGSLTATFTRQSPMVINATHTYGILLNITSYSKDLVIITISNVTTDVGAPPGTYKVIRSTEIHIPNASAYAVMTWNTTLHMRYNGTELAESGVVERTLGIYRWNGASWECLTPSYVNTEEQYVWAYLDHFSVFALMGDMPPTAVTFSMGDITESSMRLMWAANTDPDFARYEIFRSTISGVLGTSIANVTGQAATSLTVSGLSSGTRYYFTVRVWDTVGLYRDSTQNATTAVPIWQQSWFIASILAIVVIVTVSLILVLRRRETRGTK